MCDINMAWQCFGRAARGPGRVGLAVLFADTKHFHEAREEAEKRAQKKAEAAARKAVEKEQGKQKQNPTDAGDSANKRRRLNGRANDSQLLRVQGRSQEETVDGVADHEPVAEQVVVAVPAVLPVQQVQMELTTYER